MQRPVRTDLEEQAATEIDRTSRGDAPGAALRGRDCAKAALPHDQAGSGIERVDRAAFGCGEDERLTVDVRRERGGVHGSVELSRPLEAKLRDRLERQCLRRDGVAELVVVPVARPGVRI
jgi:hypothetical protein